VDAARHRRRRLELSKPYLLINPRSGDGRTSSEELVARAAELGVEAHVLHEGEDAAELAREAVDSGAEAVGIGGGDGSLAPVAGVALERGLPFVVVPLGTRNHFARDLGLDLDDPLDALDAFAGVERSVDVGRVGERIFVNNVSLGLYASFVHDPERKTRNRLTAFLRMAPAALGRSRTPLDVSFEVSGRLEHHEALVVLVANNGYGVESLAELGERERLDEGLLHAYVIEAVSRHALTGLLLKAAIGDVEEADGLVEWAAPRLRVDLPDHRIHAAIDGEPVVLDAPLELELEARALRVLVPPARAQDEVQ
jgi:diacylglycerol kinase family enzyme